MFLKKTTNWWTSANQKKKTSDMKLYQNIHDKTCFVFDVHDYVAKLE